MSKPMITDLITHGKFKCMGILFITDRKRLGYISKEKGNNYYMGLVVKQKVDDEDIKVARNWWEKKWGLSTVLLWWCEALDDLY